MPGVSSVFGRRTRKTQRVYLEGSGEILLTEMRDDELLKLIALDLHTAVEE